MTDLPPDAEFHRRLGIEILEADAERVVGRMPVVGNRQPAGLLHGGATAALVEGLGSVAAWLAGQPDRLPVGVDLNVTHLRPARGGVVTGVATAVRIGSGTAVYTVEVTDEQGRPTAVGRLTCQLLPR
ncbi:PaaI family thioesterase [Arachnia propionica]|uniref:PaaI family thioesterase n=1 Tax=Arachnia propionica TaxID=1750 RepID=A0A3P1T6E8_9ACTN|nr:PaaI family thioesterase [Arachnia propionica]RRD04959.1 PaaI family thioesterase [Arachnia propionica]